jgi:uncharacterized protein (DUF952 family)/predicted cupin superfamily sugar epimerase
MEERRVPTIEGPTACIYHIATRAAASAARSSGEYRPESLAGEGFIHLSQAHQVLEVARLFYAGQDDLVLLVVDPGRLRSELRWEAPTMPGHSPPASPPEDFRDLFPHVYGPIGADAIIDVADLEYFDGRPIHPDTAAILGHYRFERLPVEGTLFASTWRSDREAAGGGPAGTAMIGLYAESPQSLSCFHRLDFDEVWHAYGGDPFRLYLLFPDGRADSVLMGGDPFARGGLAGQRAQFVVPAGVWQAGCLEPGGRYALFGCTMAPGFTGGCFEAGVAEELIARYPSQAEPIRRLSVNGGERRMPSGFASATISVPTASRSRPR